MAKPALNPSERALGTYRANRTQGSRSVGGHLLLTDQRVLFDPHKLDSATGGTAWECSLTSITGVGMAARGSNPFNGSLRRRLRIACGESAEHFVVNKGHAIVSAIQQAARG